MKLEIFLTRTKNLDIKILCELMKNARTSDRELAKIIGVSQPTVTRNRWKLESNGLVEYSAIPNLKKLGFEMLALNFINYRPEIRKDLQQNSELTRKIQAHLEKHPNVILASSGKGKGANGVSISIHKNYSDYVNFRNDIAEEWYPYVLSVEAFIISLKSDNILRNLTFKHFGKYLKKDPQT